MAKGYIIVTYLEAADETRRSAYGDAASKALNNTNGKFLVRGYPTEVHENGCNERVAVVEFPTLQEAINHWHSRGYQEALKLLHPSNRDARIIEGV